jgi:uncharacterized protein (DUF885 family)
MKRVLGFLALALMAMAVLFSPSNFGSPPSPTPAETRLEFENALKRYKVLTEDYYAVQNLFDQIERSTGKQLSLQDKLLENSPSISDFQDLKLKFESLNSAHLNPCAQLKYHDLFADIGYQIQRLTPRSERIDNAQKLSGLESAVQTVYGEALSLDEIEAVANTEIKEIESQLKVLEQQIVDAGYEANIDEFARTDAFFISNKDALKDTFLYLFETVNTYFSDSFYDYDVPPAKIRLIKRAHRWNAVASYNKKTMFLYLNEPRFDMKNSNFLVVHEIMPGHHLQLLSRAQGPICPDSIWSLYNGKILEGWATYAEYLAYDAGYFDSPEQLLGWLDYRHIRAMRLLMDVERYRQGGNWDKASLRVLWDARVPARLKPFFDREFARLQRSGSQHVGYIFGHMAIRKARDTIKSEQGSDFDIRRFHDVLLRGNYRYMENFTDQVRAGMAVAPLLLPEATG